MSKTGRLSLGNLESGKPLTSSQRANRFEVIVKSLEEDIVLGRLQPRERLIEEDLCERFDVSRHTLRLVLVELEQMGLIERHYNRGAVVRSFSSNEVEQLYALRELLEVAAASQVPLPVGEADLKALRDIQANHDRAVRTANLAQVFRFNHQFHRKLFALCGNPYLASAIETHAQMAHGIRFLVLSDDDHRERARQQHNDMIDALARGDRQALLDLCRDHLPASKAAYLRAYGLTHQS